MEIQIIASGSSGNCCRLCDGSSSILIDCGLPWPRIQRHIKFQASALAGVLLSHEHRDHSRAIWAAMRFGLDCCMSRGTAEALGLSGHRLQIIAPLRQFKLGAWLILPFETQHDAAEPLGFLMAGPAGEKLLFATDTAYLKYRFRGLHYLLIECSYAADILQENAAAGLVPPAVQKRMLQAHFSLDRLKNFLQAQDLSRTREIYLLHLSEQNSDAARFKREIQELTGKPVLIA